MSSGKYLRIPVLNRHGLFTGETFVLPVEAIAAGWIEAEGQKDYADTGGMAKTTAPPKQTELNKLWEANKPKQEHHHHLELISEGCGEDRYGAWRCACGMIITTTMTKEQQERVLDVTCWHMRRTMNQDGSTTCQACGETKPHGYIGPSLQDVADGKAVP